MTTPDRGQVLSGEEIALIRDRATLPGWQFLAKHPMTPDWLYTSARDMRLLATLAEREGDLEDAQAMRCLRADIRSTVDDFNEGKESFNQALHRYIGSLRAQLATRDQEIAALTERMGVEGERALDVAREKDQEIAAVRSRLEEVAGQLATVGGESMMRGFQLAKRDATIAELRGALTFTPPPGPPDLPKPSRCIHGHAVTWITNRTAICLESTDLACIWMLVPGSVTAPSRLETILNPEARAFAYQIKDALTR